MLWTGGPSDNIGSCGLETFVQKSGCANSLRSLCTATAAPQVRAMAYGMSGEPQVRNPDFMQDLVSDPKQNAHTLARIQLAP